MSDKLRENNADDEPKQPRPLTAASAVTTGVAETGASETPLGSGSGPTTNDDKVVVAGPWQLMWRKFRKHKLAMLGGVMVIFIYLIALFAEFIAPFGPSTYAALYTYAPPQTLRLVDDGRFLLHVTGYRSEIDPVALQRTFVPDPEMVIPIGFFVKGEPYRLWNLIPLDRHLVGPRDSTQPMYLLGADRLGRDLFSRIIYGTRMLMSIGLLGIALSFVLGLFLGGVSGYLGGWTDTLIQRLIEFLEAIPAIPLWMGLAAAIPLTMPPLQVYFLITLILSVVGWTGLARVARGKFYAVKSEDFVTAARLDGASTSRIIRKHLIPSFTSHIIAAITLAIPAMILGETALSFLGIGLRPPVVSWGVLLSEAQNIRAVATAPWLFWPGFAVVVAVLSLNFLGDGLRDAADPYDA